MNVTLSQALGGPLKAMRVLDITTRITGPLCSQQLGDLGADVIKIESSHGESGRCMAQPGKAGLTGVYSQLKRNKRSLAVDLKSEQDDNTSVSSGDSPVLLSFIDGRPAQFSELLWMCTSREKFIGESG